MTNFRSSKEARSFSRWTLERNPERILVIRFHAIGDVAITLPASSGLKSLFPNARIDFLASEVTAPMVRACTAFHNVHTLRVASSRAERLSETIRVAMRMHEERYEVVLDLQRNWQSRLIRHMARPLAWGEFDRFGPFAASERVVDTFHRTGFSALTQSVPLHLHNELVSRAESLLLSSGWDSRRPLIVLNPAGLWGTRNWQIENYVALARLLLSHEHVQFVLLGTERIAARANHLARALGSDVINLVSATTPGEALALLHKTSLVISEDSGLMHMAWALGIPTVALFGSSNHIWSSPTGAHTRTLHSGDLSCGACMQPTCRFGDVHCLTRVTVDLVIEAIRQLKFQGARLAPSP